MLYWGPEEPGIYRLLGFLSIFSGLQHESLFPHLRQAPVFSIDFSPPTSIPAQWYALGKFRVYFVLINTYETMSQISDVNIADEFLRGDRKSDLSLLFISARLLSIVAALRVNRIQKPRVKLQLTIYFLLTDDTEWCIAYSFTWFIKNTQRAQKMLKEDKQKAIQNLLNGCFWMLFA